MADLSEQPPDPLVAGLPPTLDYFSYLTLLEYQLTPKNLPTLNRLLQEDDGTLAQEIGWELPKLVLPMLSEAPEEATECLDIVARRGNPREIVVKIAEMLETMGSEEGRLSDDLVSKARYGTDDEDEAEDHSGTEDELLTFAGEAARIHLGAMVLDGMPQPSNSGALPKASEQDSMDDTTKDSPDKDPLILASLLTMLGIVHPRIKTEYPSRFLATSLKAALGAYRRVNITEHTTSSFLAFLHKLSGKHRPNLPPRVSTNLPTPAQLESAPLPDPEATSEAPNSKTPSATEIAIVQRLLQAVMLELLDEYSTDLQTTAQISIAWTTRLKEAFEPKRVVPGRITETQNWQTEPSLSSRDALMIRWVRLANDLSLDLEAALQENLDNSSTKDPIEDSDDIDPNSPSEYPQSPSDIPFSYGAVVILYAASHYYSQTQTQQAPSSSQLKRPSVSPNLWFKSVASHPGTLPPGAEVDALLALFYLSLQTDSSSFLAVPQVPFTALLSSLNTYSATSPDPSLRDSAHAVASRIFHACPDSEKRLRTARQLLERAGDQSSPAAQDAMLQAVVIDWVKDEFLAFFRRCGDNSAAEPPSPGSNVARVGMDPAILDTDIPFQHLVFLSIANTPTAQSTHEDIAAIRTRVPAYISGLNLFTVLRKKTALKLELAEDMVMGLVRPLKSMVEMSISGGDGDGGGAPVVLWALENALKRAVDAMNGL